MIDCQYWTKKGNDGGLCALKLYGGFPSLGCCKKCLSAGENNPEYAKSIVEQYERTHPEPFRGKSSCCDSALNYPKSS